MDSAPVATYYYDGSTETVRRYQNDEQTGERWAKELHMWSQSCCARSACKWDEVVTEEQAKKIISSQ